MRSSWPCRPPAGLRGKRDGNRAGRRTVGQPRDANWDSLSAASRPRDPVRTDVSCGDCAAHDGHVGGRRGRVVHLPADARGGDGAGQCTESPLDAQTGRAEHSVATAFPRATRLPRPTTTSWPRRPPAGPRARRRPRWPTHGRDASHSEPVLRRARRRDRGAPCEAMAAAALHTVGTTMPRPARLSRAAAVREQGPPARAAPCAPSSLSPSLSPP